MWYFSSVECSEGSSGLERYVVAMASGRAPASGCMVASWPDVSPPTTFGLGNGNLLGPSNSTNGKTKARARDQSPNKERRVRLGSLLSLDMLMDC